MTIADIVTGEPYKERIMGNPKLPTNIKQLKGTLQKCRQPKNEPHPDPKIPTPPKFMSDEAKKEWNRISVELYKMGLLSEMDRASLALYCQSWGRILQYEQKVREEIDQDEIYKLLRVLAREYDSARKFLTEFGMSPASRSKISVKKKSGKTNLFDKY